jgi:hypothetical protein
MTKLPLLLSVLVLATPALAGPREDTLAGISRCAALPDDRTFLDCIYGAAQPMRSKLGLSPAPAGQLRLVPPAYLAPAAPPVAAYAPASRAMPPAPPPAAAKPVGVLASFLGNDPSAAWIETFSFDRHHLFTVTFSNGQIWRQDPSDTARAHWAGRASDYSIKLAINGDGRSGTLWVRGDASTYQVRKLR